MNSTPANEGNSVYNNVKCTICKSSVPEYLCIARSTLYWPTRIADINCALRFGISLLKTFTGESAHLYSFEVQRNLSKMTIQYSIDIYSGPVVSDRFRNAVTQRSQKRQLEIFRLTTSLRQCSTKCVPPGQ